jgi:predicted ester cyclase
MGTRNNKEITRRFYEQLYNERDLELIGELLTPGSVLHVMGEHKVGRETARRSFEDVWFASFPDIRVSVDDQIAEGDRVCDRCTVSGTHTGAPYLGIGAAGRPFQFTMTVISRLENGQIAEAWEDLDFFSFVRQLGATVKRPEPAGAA